MGLLDDAIREHLELKRKHGADPEDVARQEQEALGPGKRNEFAQPEEEPAAVSVSEPADEPEPPLQEEPPALRAPARPRGPRSRLQAARTRCAGSARGLRALGVRRPPDWLRAYV